MKKIYAFLAVLPIVMACEVSMSQVSPVTSHTLETYAKKKLVEYVAMPAEALEFAIEFDAYLKMSDLEQEADYRFFANTKEIEPGVYEVSYQSTKDHRNIDFTVDTQGASITEEGAVWKMRSFSCHGSELIYHSSGSSFRLAEDSELMMISAADSTWAVKMGQTGSAKLRMHPMRDKLYEWTVESRGSEETDMDIMSEFGTTGPFTLRERYLENGETSNVYLGNFNVDIYRNGEPLDYCRLHFAKGMQITVKTSR